MKFKKIFDLVNRTMHLVNGIDREHHQELTKNSEPVKTFFMDAFKKELIQQW